MITLYNKVRVSYDSNREQWRLEVSKGDEYELWKVFDTTRILDEDGNELEGGFAYVSDELICDLVEAQDMDFDIELTI